MIEFLFLVMTQAAMGEPAAQPTQAPSEASAPAPAAGTEAQEQTPPPDPRMRVRCRMERPIGSRIGARRCTTARRDQEQAEAGRRTTQDLQRSGNLSPLSGN